MVYFLFSILLFLQLFKVVSLSLAITKSLLTTLSSGKLLHYLMQVFLLLV